MKTTNLPAQSNSLDVPVGKFQMGFSPLNIMLTGGLPIDQMVTIGAFCNRPEERNYKSNLTMSLAQRAVAQGKKVVFVTPELMSDVEHQRDIAEMFRSLGLSAKNTKRQ